MDSCVVGRYGVAWVPGIQADLMSLLDWQVWAEAKLFGNMFCIYDSHIVSYGGSEDLNGIVRLHSGAWSPCETVVAVRRFIGGLHAVMRTIRSFDEFVGNFHPMEVLIHYNGNEFKVMLRYRGDSAPSAELYIVPSSCMQDVYYEQPVPKVTLLNYLFMMFPSFLTLGLEVALDQPWSRDYCSGMLSGLGFLGKVCALLEERGSVIF